MHVGVKWREMSTTLDRIEIQIRVYERELDTLRAQKIIEMQKLEELKRTTDPIRTIQVDLTPPRLPPVRYNDEVYFKRLVDESDDNVTLWNQTLKLNVHTNQMRFGNGEDRVFETRDPLYDLDLNHKWVVSYYRLYMSYKQPIRKITLHVAGDENRLFNFECVSSTHFQLSPLPPVIPSKR
jgi:hypothetical protein